MLHFLFFIVNFAGRLEIENIDIQMKPSILFFRIYQWLIAAPILLVLTIITALTTMLGTYLDRDWWAYYPPRLWARCWCVLLGVKVTVTGRENINSSTSYVFVANHQGAFDIFSIYGYLDHDFKWMMRKGLANIPLVGTACLRAGHIMVDTHSAHGLKQTIDNAENQLKNGTSLVVFPEGRRTSTGQMGAFKPGAFKLAEEFRLPVVPITINGSYRVMPRSTFNVTPGTITLTIHSPIEPGENGHDINEVSRISKEIISSALH